MSDRGRGGCRRRDGAGPRRRGRGAFTLVELLIVVAIIGILIAIVVPSLQRAREITRRTICQLNLSHIYKATDVYAENDRGKYPRYMQTGQDWGFLPYSTRNVYDAQIYDRNTRWMIPLNLCVILREDLLSGPKALYCPSQPHPYYRFENYPRKFTEDNAELPGYWRTAYLYNPHVTYKPPEGDFRGGQHRAYTHKEEFPPKKVFAMDILHEETSIPHYDAEDEPGWNLALGDGSVRYRTSQKALRLIRQYYYVGNAWHSFDKARNELEGVEGP